MLINICADTTTEDACRAVSRLTSSSVNVRRLPLSESKMADDATRNGLLDRTLPGMKSFHSGCKISDYQRLSRYSYSDLDRYNDAANDDIIKSSTTASLRVHFTDCNNDPASTSSVERNYGYCNGGQDKAFWVIDANGFPVLADYPV